MRFIGVDLAWKPRKTTGLCVVENGRVCDSALLRSDEDLLAWMRPYTEGPVLVAVDAPLIVTNAVGMRPCERMISKCFGAHEASARPANLGRPAFMAGVRGADLMARLGLDLDPAFVPATPVRRAIEVYPHPAIVALFGLSETLKYKAKSGRTLSSRTLALGELMDHLESLEPASPPLAVTASPRWVTLRDTVGDPGSGAELDRAEDEIDAYVCAYIALYYWTHGGGACRVVGDLATGYIVTPVNADQARCLDAQRIQLGTPEREGAETLPHGALDRQGPAGSPPTGSRYPVSVEHVERLRVAWVDTDAGGRIHFSNAFRWAEIAETGLMRRLGMLEEWGDYPRRHAEAEFHKVLRFEDEIEVRLRVERVGRTSIIYGWTISKDGEAHITGRHTVVNVDREGRPEELPDRVREALSGEP